MSDNTVIAKARVQVTIEVTLPDHWGWDAKVEQVHKQAAILAKESITRLIVGGIGAGSATIVGEPRVVMVLAEKDPR